MKVYPNCLVGKELVDFLVRSLQVDSRVEGVQLGRKVSVPPRVALLRSSGCNG